MTVLITVITAKGTTRVCGARCHRGNPERKHKSECVCGGLFRGIGDEAAANMPWEHLQHVREQIKLRDGETVQMRVGA